MHFKNEIFWFQLPTTENLDARPLAFDESDLTQTGFIHFCSIGEKIQAVQIDGGETLGEYRVVKSSFRNSPDQRHLSTFKPQTQTPSRAGFLSFMTLP